MDNLTINCGACRDLLPLYAEGMACDESVALTEAHLNACAACRAELARVRENPAPTQIPFEKGMRRAKRKLNRKKTIIAIVSSLLAMVVMIVLYVCLFKTLIPLKTPPSDLQCSAENGVVTITSSWDSQHGYMSGSEVVLADGSKAYVIMFSLADPPVHKLFPRHSVTSNPASIGNQNHGMKLEFNASDAAKLSLFPWKSAASDPASVGNQGDGMEMEPNAGEWDGGMCRVYFVQERELKKGRIEIDETTGKLTEESMQYATLVWEETIA
ncbi:MAG: hypothetical protein FWC27_01020 [Firmicutes bacterium]|nr:hypothetical protein [Bacillota bacterium]